MHNNYYICDNIKQLRLTKSFLLTRHRHLTLKIRDLNKKDKDIVAVFVFLNE